MIEFAPTFKRKMGDNTAYKIKRNPSWTDRVLYRFDKEKCHVDLKSYDSNNLLVLSDHRPVFAQFIVNIDMSGLQRKFTVKSNKQSENQVEYIVD